MMMNDDDDDDDDEDTSTVDELDRRRLQAHLMNWIGAEYKHI